MLHLAAETVATSIEVGIGVRSYNPIYIKNVDYLISNRLQLSTFTQMNLFNISGSKIKDIDTAFYIHNILFNTSGSVFEVVSSYV